jgi:hypothetical protein
MWFGHIISAEDGFAIIRDVTHAQAKLLAKFTRAASAKSEPATGQQALLDDMPKDGSPFLAWVRDWYHGDQRYALLKLSMAGNGQCWDTSYTGDQTYDRADILKCWHLESSAHSDAVVKADSAA